MLNALPNARPFGFSLIELMVGVSIMAILATVAMPNFQIWLQNSQIRTAAESVSSGLQRARAEAVARNTNVTFTVWTDSSWTISVVAPASVIESRSASEGSKNVTRTVLPADATTITFNNFGGVVANADASATFTQVEFDSPVLPAAESKELRVTIGAGGNARMCDPNLAAGSSPRAC